jgi:hypothetical protein
MKWLRYWIFVMDNKNKNRLLMPETAKIVDKFRTVFPTIKVLYAEEGDYRVGKKPDRSKYVVPCIDERKLVKKERKK